MKNIKNFLGVILVVISIIICTPIKAEAEHVVKENPLKLILNENGHLEVRASAPGDGIDFLLKIMYSFIEDYGFDVDKIDIPDISDDFKRIKLTIDKGEVAAEWIDVDYIYDESAEQKVNEALELFTNMEPSTSSGPGYVLRISDLEMIHHYYYSDKYKFVVYEEQEVEKRLNFINSFSSKIKADVKNGNLNFRLMAFILENGNLIKGESIGAIGAFEYNNSIYYIDQNGVEFDLSHVFYVPSDTPNRAEDIKVAAQKRINDYLNNEKVTIDYISENVRTVEDYLSLSHINAENVTEYFESNYRISDVTKDDFIYKVTIQLNNNQEKVFYMIIKRDSEKMVSSFQSTDLLSGIEVSANKTLTLDTLLSVSKVTSGTEYDRITTLLALTDSVTYDIKLYSKLEDKYIFELEDGTFEVKIPISENLQGKDLTAYYVDENGKIEEYEVEIKDGYAIFKTNHFSIYTLGNTKKNSSNEETNNPNVPTNEETNNLNNPTNEEIIKSNNESNNEENPKTADNILLYVATSIISLAGLGAIGIYTYRRKQTN